MITTDLSRLVFLSLLLCLVASGNVFFPSFVKATTTEVYSTTTEAILGVLQETLSTMNLWFAFVLFMLVVIFFLILALR